MILKVNKIIFWLLFINTLATLLWILPIPNIDTIRIVLLVGTSFTLFLFLFYKIKVPMELWIYRVVVIWLMIIGIRNFGNVDFATTYIQDISIVGMLGALFHMKGLTLTQRKRLGLFLFTVPTIFLLITSAFVDLSYLLLSEFSRDDLFSSSDLKLSTSSGMASGYFIYSIQGQMIVLLNVFLLLLPLYYNRKYKKYYLLGISMIVLMVCIYSFIYQKKQPFVEIMIILFILLFLYKRLLPGLFPFNKFVAILFFIGLLGLLITSDFAASLMGRFTQLKQLNDFDRFEEASSVFDNYSILDWIVGRGFGSIAKGTDGYTMLHAGYANLFFKGGVILFLTYFVLMFRNLNYCVNNLKKQPFLIIGIAVTIFIFIQLFYTGVYHFYSNQALIGLAFYARNFLDNSELQNNPLTY